MHGIHAAEKLFISKSEKCVEQFDVPKCEFHAKLYTSWRWMMSKYVFLLNVLVICLMCNIRPIIAIIFHRFSVEVSCLCLSLREIINKSTAIAFLYIILVSDIPTRSKQLK